MRAPLILVVGDIFPTFEEYLASHGFNYAVLQDVRKTKKAANRIPCDFSSAGAIKDAADQARAKVGKIDAVVAMYERFVLPAAEIAAHLGLPGLPLEAARACTDKFLMRSKFATCPEKISPDFAVVTGEEDVKTFAAAHNFPLILKPANLSKSLLVFKNHDLDELMRNYRRLAENVHTVYAKYAPHTKPKVIIEEFMAGPVHSVDAFVDGKGQPHVLEQVVDYQTGYEIGYDDNFHYSRIIPSRLPKSDVDAIRHTAELGCRTLGMKNSPAHIEVIITDDGPRIVEIGARNGGYRDRMHSSANGIDITGNALALALGRPLDLQAKCNDSVGVFELFPKTPGVFAGIKNQAELEKLPSLNYFSLKVSPGQFVGKSSDGFKMCAVVFLHHKNANQFARDVRYLNEHASVITS